MDKLATENLFLLEFLVDSVNIDPKCECDAPPGETCVSFQFLDNAPLDVCEADFAPKRTITNDKKSIKSGKSCLFSLSPEQAIAAVEKFDVYVTIIRKMQPGWLPEKIEMGMALLAISNLFSDLIDSVEVSDGSSPTAKSLKDEFDIQNSSAEVIGKISVYIRMSCFGKLIVTQFQMNLDDKSVLFKDKEGKSLYRYKKAGKGDKVKNENGNVQQNHGYNATCPTTPCVMPSFGNDNRDPNCPNAPCGPNGMEGGMSGIGAMGGMGGGCGAGGMGGMGGMGTMGGMGAMGGGCGAGGMGAMGGMGGMGAMSGGCGGGGMGASGGMGGGYGAGGFPMSPCNECGTLPYIPCLPPDQQPGQQVPQYPPVPSQPPMMPPGPGNYQEIGASMGGNSLTIRVHKDKNTVEQIDPNMTDDLCTCGGGGSQQPRTQSFEMRPGVQQGNQNAPFAFNMRDFGNRGDNNNNIVVNPPTCTDGNGGQFTEFSDPNKETFVLRIGKKTEGADKKNKLELELCTPKGLDRKPIPTKETRDTQYDSQDVPKNGSKKGKGKGKKKK